MTWRQRRFGGWQLAQLFFRKRPLLVPEPGQKVRLRAGRGRRWRGNFRAISYPYTHEGLGVVVRVVEEGEYREAVREGRRTVGMPWPAPQIEPLSPSEGAEQDTQELPLSQRPRQGMRGSLRLIFGW
jgi:hypothetical protein